MVLTLYLCGEFYEESGTYISKNTYNSIIDVIKELPEDPYPMLLSTLFLGYVYCSFLNTREEVLVVLIWVLSVKSVCSSLFLLQSYLL